MFSNFLDRRLMEEDYINSYRICTKGREWEFRGPWWKSAENWVLG